MNLEKILFSILKISKNCENSFTKLIPNSSLLVVLDCNHYVTFQIDHKCTKLEIRKSIQAMTLVTQGIAWQSDFK